MIRIGTRSSKLAIAQAGVVAALLRQAHPGIEIEIVPKKSAGDRDRATPLEVLGGSGAFTKVLEDELARGTIDIAVHSAKDLPTRIHEGLEIAAVPPRGPCRDAWLAASGRRIPDMEPGALVGTGSPRRRAELLWQRGDLVVRSVRGNVDTRLAKLGRGEFDALIMAEAGLARSGLAVYITEVLDPEIFVPAAGQGALAVETRRGDRETASLCASIDHPPSHRSLRLEKEVLARLGAGCTTPVGVHAVIEDDRIRLSAVILDREGKTRLFVRREMEKSIDDHALAGEVVRELFARGAAELVRDGP